MYQPDTLSIVTTYKCTAACEHCCFHCSPRRTEKLSFDNMKKYIRDAYDVPSIKLIVFTGGECFTLGDELVSAIEYANNLGLATRCVSNGSWAATDLSAKRTFERVRKVGLTEINFSTGDHHAAHVPIDTVLRGIRTTCESGMVTAVNIELFEGSKTKPFFKSLFKSWKKKYPCLYVNYGLWIPNGGTTKLKHNDFFKQLTFKEKRGCNSVLSSVSVSPRGRLTACCGLYSDYIPELVLGDLNNEKLDSILARQTRNKEDIIKIALAVEGPEAVLSQAHEYNPRISVKDNYVHPCQSCLQIYRNKKNREAIVKACKEHEEELYSTYRIANAMEDVIMGREKHAN